MKGKLVIRIDDVHPKMNWENFKYFTSKLLKRNQVGLLGVIPDCRDPKLAFGEYQPEFWDYIRFLKANNWEIAQHGYQHLYDTKGGSILVGFDQSEFSSHDFSTQVMKLKQGKNILSMEGLETDIFMAPGHHFDDVTLNALTSTGFKYITDGHAFFSFNHESLNLIFVPQLISRPHGMFFGVYSTCCHLDKMKVTEIDNFLDKTNKYNIISFSDALTFKHPLGTEVLSKSIAGSAINLKRIINFRKKQLKQVFK